VKRVTALLVLGALAPMIQGVVGTFFPARYGPDLSLLLVIGLGLYWRSAAGGAALATLFGFIADLLSGSLFGQHALLRVFAFGTARLFSRQLNLRGPLPQVTFVIAFSVANALASALLTLFFASGPGFDLVIARDLVPHALINGAFAVPVIGLVQRVSDWLGDEQGRQLLVMQSRKRMT
jgi:rod shape-determining protein MreD